MTAPNAVRAAHLDSFPTPNLRATPHCFAAESDLLTLALTGSNDGRFARFGRAVLE
jgi:hypothetical protein